MQLLLVDSEAVAERLAACVPGLHVTPAASPVAARARLASGAFDAVACRAEADARDLRALANVLGLRVDIQSYTSEDALADALALRVEVAPEAPSDSENRDRIADAGVREALETVRDELARIAHTLNNPLAVIAGNAQLGREIALATGAEPEVVQALDNVDAAAGALGSLFSEIGALRTHLSRLLDPDREGA